MKPPTKSVVVDGGLVADWARFLHHGAPGSTLSIFRIIPIALLTCGRLLPATSIQVSIANQSSRNSSRVKAMSNAPSDRRSLSRHCATSGCWQDSRYSRAFLVTRMICRVFVFRFGQAVPEPRFDTRCVYRGHIDNFGVEPILLLDNKRLRTGS